MIFSVDLDRISSLFNLSGAPRNGVIPPLASPNRLARFARPLPSLSPFSSPPSCPLALAPALHHQLFLLTPPRMNDLGFIRGGVSSRGGVSNWISPDSYSESKQFLDFLLSNISELCSHLSLGARYTSVCCSQSRANTEGPHGIPVRSSLEFTTSNHAEAGR